MKFYITTLLFLVFNLAYSQVIDPVKWDVYVTRENNSEATVFFKATVDESWHIYAQDPNGGYNPTTFTFEPSENYELVGNVKEPDNFIRKNDEILGVEYNLYSHEVLFEQQLKLKSDQPFSFEGMISFFSCDDQKCLPPKDEEFSVLINGKGGEVESNKKETVKKEEKTIAIQPLKTESTEQFTQAEPEEENDNVNTEDVNKSSETEEKKERSLFNLILISFLGGLGALLTPCVYPIIPLTVSFFMRSAGQNRKKSIVSGVMFSLSIIMIYTSLGLIMGILQIDLTGPVASHWLSNSIFFIVFLIFAFSFYGMFELVLPSKWSNSIDAKADKGGFLGTFFMALATVLISFSCTGPIVGVLIGKSLQGELIQPVVGMFAFSLAFSLPFPLLAMFPNMIKNMPKSGGWMNSVKVFFAFVMLAFSMKFLHNIDKVLHWNIVSRELFIAVWIVLFFLLGMYFLGKVKFSHDSDMPYVGVPRFMLALVSFIFSVYLFTGLFGAELKGLSAILPAKNVTAGNFIQTGQVGSPGGTAQNTLCGDAKYSDFLHLPHGLQGYYDLEEGIACAKEQNKPVFLDFKGHVCTNCKEMEQKVWSDPRVLQRLRDDYVIVALYTDDRTKLPEDEWYTSEVDGKEKKTLGKQNLDFQIEKFETNSIPYYVLTDYEGDVLADPRGHNLDIDAFIAFLDNGVEEFQSK